MANAVAATQGDDRWPTHDLAYIFEAVGAAVCTIGGWSNIANMSEIFLYQYLARPVCVFYFQMSASAALP